MGNVLNTAYKVVADVIESEENINIEQGTLHVIDDKLKVHLDGEIKEVSTKSYKVYTALLTQSGVDNWQNQQSGLLTVGVTYYIEDNEGSPDFTNVGAPNNNVGTYFVATGTTPTSWGEATLNYNSGAPVVTILENTIGNIWFKYEGIGFYSVNSNGLFVTNKTYRNPVNYNLPNGVTEGYNFIIEDNNTITFLVLQGGNTQDSSLLNTPIEIRVYN